MRQQLAGRAGYLIYIEKEAGMVLQVRCPNCQSLNVEPQGKTWHCNDCGRDFEEMMVELPPPEKPKRKEKK